MATGKRFYWMKLKESFMTSDTIDYFMSQPNGAQYVVLYQMLCLKTINTDGKLERKIGEVIIPYDISKIQRDTKWFSEDTIRVALQLYKSFELIYEDQNGVLVMADHDNLVGSETDYATQKKKQRLGKQDQRKLPFNGVDNGKENTTDNVHTDNRDQRLNKEKREKEIDGDDGFGMGLGEVQQISLDHSEILDAAENAGFAQNRGTWDKIIDLYAEFGKDTVLYGISACVEQSVAKVAYLRKVCQSHVNGEKKDKTDPLMPKDHEFIGW